MKTKKDRGTTNDRVPRRPPGRGRPWQVWAALAGAGLVTTLLAAGCSVGPATSAGGAGGTVTGDTVADPLVARGDQDLVSYARCMRAHGVEMRDPYHQPGHIGLTVDMPAQNAVTLRAEAACNHYMQDLIQIKEARTAALASSRLAALTQYAECMRAHDITMLDPNARRELDLGDVPGMANNDFGRSSPQFHAADAACRHLLPAGVADDGTGP